ncbi:hypothetical protein FEE95_00290 [Maribacter algarum]|uniref:Uncharacterized protein n=1 Tax=Maribacter algarum (ex Zhang et al. 2020) TaxID=2578118 RepID=A0A5S3PXB5_9FLAO|nr:hypothetical protein [Maribacter algarum]TMM57907.1 hypothetical protein FEE95_00290 [Maribacter algarum]
MKLIPSRKIELYTSLPIEEVEKIIVENVQEAKGMDFRLSKPKNQKLFEGNYARNQFEIQRVINYRNSFLPQIKGNILPATSGSKIIAELKMHDFVLVFMLIWLGGAALASIGTIYSILTNGIQSFFSAIPLVMLTFGAAMVYFAFKYEADKAVDELKRIFKARLRDNLR